MFAKVISPCEFLFLILQCDQKCWSDESDRRNSVGCIFYFQCLVARVLRLAQKLRPRINLDATRLSLLRYYNWWYSHFVHCWMGVNLVVSVLRCTGAGYSHSMSQPR